MPLIEIKSNDIVLLKQQQQQQLDQEQLKQEQKLQQQPFDGISKMNIDHQQLLQPVGGNNNQIGAFQTKYESDPSIFQFLQTTIQLIYKTRSIHNNHINNNNNINNQNNNNKNEDNSIQFNLNSIITKYIQNGIMSIPISLDDLGSLKNIDINLDLDEINEINRDLLLWCDHLDSTPLKIDIFECKKINPTQPLQEVEYTHILLERWIFSFKPKPILLNELTISDELQSIMTPMNDISISTTNQQPNNLQNNNNIFNSSGENGNNETHLLKCLYHTLSSMPLYSHLESIKSNSQKLKIKYGVSSLFPPPINFNPIEYSNQVKINFPTFETSRGTLSLSVLFSNRQNSLNFDINDSTLIIYPSRSFSNLNCHSITFTPSKLSNSNNNISILNKTQQKHIKPISTPPTTTTTTNTHIITNDTQTKASSPSSPSLPISIPSRTSSNSLNNNNITITPPLTSSSPSFINISSSSNNNNNNTLNNSFKNNNFQSKSPFSLYNDQSFSPSTPPSYKFSPFSPNSPTYFQNIKTLPSPPSSPMRIGHRPLFVDGLYSSPSGIGGMMMKSASHSSIQQTTYNEFGFNNNNSIGGINSGLSFGSFQESILSGNMSNTPSTVFDGYLGDLGVSGKDYLPPHKKIPFSAIYYHVDHDIPYVATMDLGRKGLYRVPQKGLIQLTLFNPNHTPIKTFLVNFDLSNMPAETKTFIRQKIISTNNQNNNNNLNISPTKLQQQSNNNNNNQNNEILKYAIHLRFISPKKKKYYLYKNIRVVFPNRLPDEMEKLKIVYEYPPEPIYFPTLDFTN